MRSKALLLAALLIAGPAFARAEEPKSSPWLSTTPAHIATDEEVRTAVLKGIMANPNVFAADLRARVKNGMVTLTGTVRSEEAKKTAGDIAHKAPGARQIDNRLRVRG